MFGNVFVGLVDAWQNWHYRDGPTRRDLRRAREQSQRLTPYNRAGERAWFAVNTQRQAQYGMLREQSRPRLVDQRCSCNDPRCTR